MNAGRTLAARLRDGLTDENRGKRMVFKENVRDIAFSLTIKDSDRLAMQVERAEVADTATGPKMTQEKLLACAQALQKQLSNLFGELDILEVDTTNSKVQLRSKVEHKPKSSQGYYEVVVNAEGTLTLSKYNYGRSAKARTCMPFSMTIEMVEPFINDVAAALKLPVAGQED